MAIDCSTVIGTGGVFPEAPDLTREELRTLLSTMVRVRVLDERGMNLQRQGRINFYVPSTGQEASQIGSAFAFTRDDWLFPAYRDPGVLLVAGASVGEMVHQLFGTRKDRIKGRQMPNHYAFREFHLPSISSPIATQLPHAVGVAMGMKYKKAATAVGVYLGEGGTSEGDFHVAMNFAGVFRAPVVFLCENNQWAITVPASKQSGSDSFAVKARAYGIPGVKVDGNDVLAVYRATREAVDRARAGGGTTFLEMVTYRMGPHSTSDDPRRYRDEAEVEAWRLKDPIARFQKRLVGDGVVTDKEVEKMFDDAREEVLSAVREAESTPPPLLADVFGDVFAEMTPELARQKDDLARFHPEHDSKHENQGR